MLKHYVLIKCKDNTPSEHIELFCKRMYLLKDLIPEIINLKIGQDVLHDSRSWDLILIMKFKSIESLRSYQKHPEHLAAMKFNDSYVAQVASIDFK